MLPRATSAEPVSTFQAACRLLALNPPNLQRLTLLQRWLCHQWRTSVIKSLNTACLCELWVGDQSTWEIHGFFSFPLCQVPGASGVQEKTPWPLPGKCGMGSANAEQLFPDKKELCSALSLFGSVHYTEEWLGSQCGSRAKSEYLTQCSAGKLLVHVSKKALRTPPVYQLFCVW